MNVSPWLAIAACLTIAGCTHGKPRSAGTDAAYPSLVYLVERDGARSHLMGTCHLPLALDTRVDPALIDTARAVWIEAQIDGLDPMASLARIWDDERTLSDELDRRTFAALARQNPALPASMVDHMKPWVLGVLMGMNELFGPAETEAMFKGSIDATLDAQVAIHAREQQVEVRYLETLDEQLGFFEGQDTDFEALLFPSEAQRNENRDSAAAVLELCYRQDLGTVPKALYADTPENRTLLTDRNHRWVETLKPELLQGGAFVAVGSLHLAGPDGLVKLLQQEGFQVTRLPARQAPTEPPTLPVIERPPPELMPLEQRDAFAAQFAPTMCVPEQAAMACFHPEAPVCNAAMEKAARICVDQHFRTPEELQQSAGTNQAFVGCLVSGMIGQSMARGFPDRPACQPIEAAIRASQVRP